MPAPTSDRIAYSSGSSRHRKPIPHRTWRDTPERIIHGYSGLPRAASLSPDERTVFDCAAGSLLAQAIVAAWAFSEPIVVQEEA